MIGHPRRRIEADTRGTNRWYRRRVTKAGTRGWARRVTCRMSVSDWWLAPMTIGDAVGSVPRRRKRAPPMVSSPRIPWAMAFMYTLTRRKR
jgi:hypothetical protein